MVEVRASMIAQLPESGGNVEKVLLRGNVRLGFKEREDRS